MPGRCTLHVSDAERNSQIQTGGARRGAGRPRACASPSGPECPGSCSFAAAAARGRDPRSPFCALEPFGRTSNTPTHHNTTPGPGRSLGCRLPGRAAPPAPFPLAQNHTRAAAPGAHRAHCPTPLIQQQPARRPLGRRRAATLDDGTHFGGASHPASDERNPPRPHAGAQQPAPRGAARTPLRRRRARGRLRPARMPAGDAPIPGAPPGAFSLPATSSNPISRRASVRGRPLDPFGTHPMHSLIPTQVWRARALPGAPRPACLASSDSHTPPHTYTHAPRALHWKPQTDFESRPGAGPRPASRCGASARAFALRRRTLCRPGPSP